ncbi:MAG: SAM-dependent methyltransferase, partial [Gammaproteobacteria bacterium]|nr:SAM-dependent methyltransferase [Gammaproteobacteria bacterium]
MIISLALLGYGASGTFLSLFRHYLLPRYSRVYLTNLVLFALSSLLCFLLSQQIPFNAEEMLWDAGQSLRLMSIYILLALPFFFVANAIGLTLIRYQHDMSRIYAADLFGAGVGSVLIIVLLFVALPAESLRYIFVLAMLAIMLASWELYKGRGRIFVVMISMILLSIVFSFLLPKSWTELELSPYKGLSQTLRITGTNVVSESSSPLGLITVVESPVIPFRYAPGLSLNASDEPPQQVAVIIDGDAMTPITHYSGDRQTLTYLDQLTSALPYHLSPTNNVLILGAGGGSKVLQAKYHKAKQITAVELDKQIIKLVKTDFKNFSGSLYNDADINVIADEARGFVAGSDHSYDLIQLALLDSFSASSAGLYALSENYLYTVEALQEYLLHLNSAGYLALTRWIKLPPRDTFKMFATAIDALRNNGIYQPEQNLVLIRSLQTSTLLIKNTPFTADEILSLKKFCEERSFDMAYYPGMSFEEANLYNILAKPVFFTGAISLLGDDRNNFIQRYKFNIEPATDNKPYFFNYFKWGVLPEILSLKGEGGMSLLGMGYLMLVATLLQALLFSFLIILLPLMFFKRTEVRVISKNYLKTRAFIYFLALGLAFLFIEIAFIQKFILFLHHPVFAIAVVLSAFLIFAGMGSLWSKRFVKSEQYDKGVKLSVLMIVVIGICYAYFLGPIFSYFIALSVTLKVILSIVLIAPLAFCMGMPFPLGLSRLGEV